MIRRQVRQQLLERLGTHPAVALIGPRQYGKTTLAQTLRGVIDQDRKRTGRFLLLGSVSPSLMVQVSESLAGSLSLIELTPFLRAELTTKASRERHPLFGGYPDGGVLEPKQYLRWQLSVCAAFRRRKCSGESIRGT